MVVAQHLSGKKDKKLWGNRLFWPDLNIYVLQVKKGLRENQRNQLRRVGFLGDDLFSKEKCKVM